MKTSTPSPITKTSQQRYDEMMARSAAREAQIEANHKRYLEIMAHFNKAQGK